MEMPTEMSTFDVNSKIYSKFQLGQGRVWLTVQLILKEELEDTNKKTKTLCRRKDNQNFDQFHKQLYNTLTVLKLGINCSCSHTRPWHSENSVGHCVVYPSSIYSFGLSVCIFKLFLEAMIHDLELKLRIS
jgi:hypothetical protein